MGDDTPADTLNRLPTNAASPNYGFPYCHAGVVADPDFKKTDPCSGVTQPVAALRPHVAVMGVQFYTGNIFPAEYKNALFVASKGSWNRTQKSGYDLVMVRANADGGAAQITPFITGFMDSSDQSFWGRPTYMLQLPDGSLLLPDEQLGAVYRITYARYVLPARIAPIFPGADAVELLRVCLFCWYCGGSVALGADPAIMCSMPR